MPRRRKNTWPCGECGRNAQESSIYCDSCKKWFHSACVNLSKEEFVQMGDITVPFLCKTCCNNCNGSFDIEESLKRLHAAAKMSYAELRCVALREMIASKCLLRPQYDNKAKCSLPIDDTATEIMNKVGTLPGKLLLCVPQDGNCLFSAISAGMCGHTEWSAHLRLFAAIELVLHATYYNGLYPDRDKDIFFGGVSFQEACIATTKMSAYSSAWTIHALASVIGMNINCVYPRINGYCDKYARALDRLIEPREKVHERNQIAIMWSNTRSPVDGQLWVPNHFVPVIDQNRVHIELKDSTLDSKEWPVLQKNNTRRNRYIMTEATTVISNIM